jgi:hypothetical protein
MKIGPSYGRHLPRRFIKAAVFGIAGISLLTLASLNSPAQTPTRKSEPAARILGEEAMPTETRVRQQNASPPQPLSLEEKRRHFRSVINSLDQQSKLHPELNLGQVFSPNVWKADFNLLPSPPTLTTRQPWIDKVGSLEFWQPQSVGNYKYGGKDQSEAVWDGGYKRFLDVHLNAVKGTYLLDFTVGPSKSLKVEEGAEGASPDVTMDIDVTQGHLLVPLLATKAGWYGINVSCHECGWTFYSVEINQVK